RVIAVLLRIVCLPLFQSPVRVGQIVGLGLAFGIRQRFAFVRPVERHTRGRIQNTGSTNAGHVRRVWIVPVSAEIGFAVRQTWSRSRRREIGAALSSSSTAPSALSRLTGRTGLALRRLARGESKIQK